MRRFKVALLLGLAALWLLGCGSGIDSKPKVGGGGGGETTPTDAGNSTTEDAAQSVDMAEAVPDATMTSDQAPVIIELAASPTEMSQGESVTISAVVSDPQGVADIAAGRLLDPQSQQLIGNFRAISGGSFELDVTWDDLDRIRTITFGPGGAQRAVTAEFIDNSNERSTRSVTIGLTCRGESACDGECGLEECEGTCFDPRFDYETEEHCGTCGNACGATQTCTSGSCMTPPPTFVGRSCDDPQDCGGELECFATESSGLAIPGGYCTTVCASLDACGAGAACVYFTYGGSEIPLCGKSCGSTADCRSGYECLTLENYDGVPTKVCAF